MTRLSLTPLAVLLSLAVLSACNQGGKGTESKATQSLAMPRTLRTATLPDNSRLRAFLDVNGTRQAMTISSGTATATILSLSPGSSSVSITFEYDSPDFGNRMLATAARTLVLQPGENTLAFSDQDYQFPDDDNDSYTNLSEIQNSTNPDDRADPPKQWGEARVVSFADVDAEGPSLIVGAGGNALVSWVQRAGSIPNTWANHFNAAKGWGIAQQISFAETTGILRGPVAMDAVGDGLAVWWQGENVLANRFDVAVGWGTPAVRAEFLPTQSGGWKHIAVNSHGDGVAFRSPSDQAARVVWANRFQALTGGGSPTRISNNAGEVEATGAIGAVDANGNAIAVWQQYTGPIASRGPLDLWASRYVTGWSTPIQIENVPGDSDSMDIAMDGEGNALAHWAQRVGLDVSYMAASYKVVTGTWDNAETITSGALSPSGPAVEFNAQGEALAVWIQADEIGQTTVYASGFNPVFGWTEPAPIVAERYTAGEVAAGAGALAIGDGGEAVAAWVQRTDTQSYVWASLLDPVAGWGPPVLVGLDNSAPSPGRLAPLFRLQVGIDDKGRALATWSKIRIDLVREVWSNRLQ